MTLLCVLRGPTELYRTEPDDRPVRWCFTCRRHVPHCWELWGDPGPSYYDPVWLPRCLGCGASNIYFPGCGPL